MSSLLLGNEAEARGRLLRRTLWLWALICLVVMVRTTLQPGRRSLYPLWERTGEAWRASGDLYVASPDADAFRYGPPVAGLFAGLSLLPTRLGCALWCAANGAAFVAAFLWWLREAAPWRPTAREQGWALLLAAPLAVGTLNNGQLNLQIAALFLAALAAVPRGWWWFSAGCLAWAAALKVYPLALGLLLVLAHPRHLGWRFGVALLLVGLFPFLIQAPGYVAEQYQVWWSTRLVHLDEARRSLPPEAAYRDLLLLLRRLDAPVTPLAYKAIQAGAALACAAAVLWVRWRGDRRAGELALVLGTAWILLCGPCSESCTYALAGPVVAWCLLAARHEGHPLVARAVGWAGAGVLALPVVAGLFPLVQKVHALGPHPLGLFLIVAPFVAVRLGAAGAGEAARRAA